MSGLGIAFRLGSDGPKGSDVVFTGSWNPSSVAVAMLGYFRRLTSGWCSLSQWRNSPCFSYWKHNWVTCRM